MIGYYRDVEAGNGRWIEFQETELSQVKEIAYHMTPYLLSRSPDSDSKDPIVYKGDLWFEIDHKPTEDETIETALHRSIVDTQNLKAYFESIELNPDDCNWYISGGKGFHVCVPRKSLGTNLGYENLPLIHKYVAAAISSRADISGTDYGVFATGKGHTLRVENKQRGNGFYKVQILPSDLESITSENYFEWCSEPRQPLPQKGDIPVNPELSELFQESLTNFNSKEPTKSTTAKDFEVMQGKVPKCIQWTISGHNTNHNTSNSKFNNACMALGRFVDVAGLSSNQVENLVQTFVNNWNSSRYKTKSEMVSQAKATIRSMLGKGFECRAVRSGLVGNPCNGCPLLNSCETNYSSKPVSKKTIATRKKLLKNAQGATEIRKAAISLAYALSSLIPSKYSVDEAVKIVTDLAEGIENDARKIIESQVASRRIEVRKRHTVSDAIIKRFEVHKVSGSKDRDQVAETNEQLAKKFVGVSGQSKVFLVDARGKGFGKTNNMRCVKDVSVRTRKGQQVGFLYVSHRQSLSASSASMEKLNVKDYNDIKSRDEWQGNEIAVCANSIAKVKSNRIKSDWEMLLDLTESLANNPDDVDSLKQLHDLKTKIDKTHYQIVCVDEARQTFEHFLDSNTIKNRAYILEVFKKMVRKAQMVIFADADFNDDSLNFYLSLRDGHELHMVVNDESEISTTNYFKLENFDAVRQQVINCVSQGRRGVVGCTSETEACKTFLHFKRSMRSDLRILLITAQNKGDKDQAAFLANPTKESANWDIIIHSPVISSGVSIENPNIDFTAFLGSCVIPTNEMWQTVARNRCAKDVFIAFGKLSNFDFVTDASVLKQGEVEKLKNFARDNGLEVKEVELNGLGVLRCEFIANRNADLKDFANNFILLGEENGIQFKNLKINFDNLTGLGEIVKADRVAEILKAQIIDQETADNLSNKSALMQSESYELLRFKVAVMAGIVESEKSGITINEEDVQMFLNGGDSQVRNLETLQSDPAILKEWDKRNHESSDSTKCLTSRQKVFKEFLNELADEVSEETALKACKVLRKYHKELASDFGNFNKKEFIRPIRTCSNFLEKFGFQLDKDKQKNDGKRIYKLSENLAIHTYVKNRMELKTSKILLGISQGKTALELSKILKISVIFIEKFMEGLNLSTSIESSPIDDLKGHSNDVSFLVKKRLC